MGSWDAHAHNQHNGYNRCNGHAECRLDDGGCCWADRCHNQQARKTVATYTPAVDWTMGGSMGVPLLLPAEIENQFLGLFAIF